MTLLTPCRDERHYLGQVEHGNLEIDRRARSAAHFHKRKFRASGGTDRQQDRIPTPDSCQQPTTTQTNVPWLFHLGPSDTDQARVFSQQIYARLGLKNVLLILQTDHDGRFGGAEFEKAAREFGETSPEHLEVARSTPNLDSIAAAIQSEGPEAIVLWTDAPLAQELLPLIRTAVPVTPVFLSSKAAQMGIENEGNKAGLPTAQEIRSYGQVFTVGPSEGGQEAARSKFRQLYLAQTAPGIAGNEVYEAVHLIASAVRVAGTNRVAL